ncbi:hypothetical protein FNF29_08233 [Cafeteria roenbergensis]|uniref:Protein transport protein SEC24 n=1 Tax=Cafeteria roenbergensis TaxID=33653 RepID=A0A5A8C2Q3_CAFRO|nr:hypothetical protein FNF29_08233 [Cafeteria roenbergensis]KAA0147074.1 hypothetical protein FNF31_07649 [Cafeteria roenbergensis]|eukprot:KAA0146131.1 hypothetical protein FNF29_08233 [Cafeteria roenbergensis]
MAVVDEEALAPPQYMHSTIAAFPATAELARRCAVPLGVSIQPLAESPDVPELPVVDHTALGGVVRCSECRAYINPFVDFLDGGRRWQCNICGALMPVKSNYFSPTDASGRRADVAQRPELSSGSVEYIATKEYIVRAPQPPTFVFVIDVSMQAVASGMLAVAAAAIKASLDDLPGEDRAQVGFLCFDSAIHFHRFRPGCSHPDVLTMPDLDDPFKPAPDDLVVNIADNRAAVEAFLDALPSMHAEARSADSCLGSALEAGLRIMQHVGGKLLAFSAALPTVGKGRLRPREAPQMLGSPSEYKLLSPDDDPKAQGLYYRQQAAEFSRQQISVDTFFFSPGYADVASIAAVSRFTSGQAYHYPAFTAAADGARFHADLVQDLTRTTGFEAVMRVRCSRGVRVLNFYGNFFIRGQDLLAMPNITSDTAFNIELEHASEPIAPGSKVTIQGALLYTNAKGERRITVHTLAIPVATRPLDVLQAADAEAVANMISKRGLDTVLRTGLAQGRDAIHSQVAAIVRAHHTASGAQAGGPGGSGAGPAMSLPEGLQLLPLYGLGLQKTTLFRGGNDVKSDERAALVYRALGMPVVCSTPLAYPRMFALHSLKPGEAEPIDTEAEDARAAAEGDAYEPPPTAGFSELRLPPVVGLSAASMDRAGVYLLEDGAEAFVWVGDSAPAALLTELFGVASFTGLDTSNAAMPVIGTELNGKVHALLEALADTSPMLPRVRVVVQGSGTAVEARFQARLVEDQQATLGGLASYREYLAQLNREAATGSAAAAGKHPMQLQPPAQVAPPPTGGFTRQ